MTGPGANRILLIEDIADAAEIIKLSLEEGLSTVGASVAIAGTGDEALDMLLAAQERQLPYQLVILDNLLPRRELRAPEALGVQLLVEMQRFYGLIPIGTPVIVYTEEASFGDCVRCIRAGATDYLPKASTRPGRAQSRSNLPELVARCRILLEGEKPDEDPLGRWFETFLPELERRFSGRYIGVVEAAPEVRLEGLRLGDRIVVDNESYEAVRHMVLGDRAARWTRPRIVKISPERLP